MRSTFDLIQAEALLKKIKPNSNQALILKVMLRHMEICSDVIKRYAEDKDFGRSLNHSVTHTAKVLRFSEAANEEHYRWNYVGDPRSMRDPGKAAPRFVG